MFSPNMDKLQEPVALTPGRSFVLYLKPFRKPENWMADDVNITRRTVLLTKAVRWRAVGGEVKVAFNYDTHPGPPTKYFQEASGEFAVNEKMECVSFYAPVDGRRATTLYFEVM